MHHSHDKSGGNTLATDVADAEEQLLVADEMVVEVAAHNLCGDKRTVYVDIVT